MTWYVVTEREQCEDETEEEFRSGDHWTVSKNPTEAGWETDSGCNRYGLLYSDAVFLCDAANRLEAERALSKTKVPVKDLKTAWAEYYRAQAAITLAQAETIRRQVPKLAALGEECARAGLALAAAIERGS